MMKVICDNEWRLVGFDDKFIKQGAFVFEHNKFGDIMILQRVKYVIKDLNIVLFFDALADKVVSVSNQCRTRVKETMPKLARAIYDNVSLDTKIVQLTDVLQSAHS